MKAEAQYLVIVTRRPGVAVCHEPGQWVGSGDQALWLANRIRDENPGVGVKLLKVIAEVRPDPEAP